MTRDETKSYRIAKQLVKVLVDIETFQSDIDMIFEDCKVVMLRGYGLPDKQEKEVLAVLEGIKQGFMGKVN